MLAVDWGTIFEQTLQQALGDQAVVFALAAIGLNVHFGYTGLLNFGQVGFMAVGSYGLALTVDYLGWSLWLGIPVGILASVVLALLLGLPTLRLRADYLAITTIAASEIIRILARSTALERFTGGSEGVEAFADEFFDPSPFATEGLQEFGFGPLTYLGNQAWVVLVGWIVVALSVLVVWQLMRSPWGRVVKAIREDEDAARALGKNAYSFKIQALILGGVFGGLAGMLQAVSRQSVQPDALVPTITFWMWTILILGGVGKVWSPVAGSIIFWGIITFAENLMRELVEDGTISTDIVAANEVGQVRYWIVGIGLMSLMAFRPQGIFGNREEMALDDR